tara:strand:- start:1266 stop:1535 length:270 start_codon:yes stop_codon:yes gene_type:complete
MKKISSFLPDNVLNKKLLINNLNQFINENFPKDIINEIKIINAKDGLVIIGCKNSSLATTLKFEKNKYLKLLERNAFLEITDLKIIIDN